VTGSIDFRHDEENDVVIATPHWKILNEADVIGWYGQYVRYMARFGRPMDCVFVLDDFEVAPAIGSKWGEYRARMLKEFTRYHYRVHPKRDVKFFSTTSGIRYNVASDVADSVEDAISRILTDRRATTSEPRT